MASRRDYTRKNANGFTLVEVLISIGILGLIAGLGLFISFDVYRHGTFHSEQGEIVSILQKARSQSINNIDQVRHGVHFQSNPLTYILFECPSGTPQCSSYTASSSDVSVTASNNVSVTSTLPMDIIFSQLSGDCISCVSAQTLTVNNGPSTNSITINSEGRIDD